MNSISVSHIGERISDVQQLLSHIRPGNGRERRPVPTHVVPRGVNGTLVIAAADQKNGESYRDWLFKTSARSVWASYAEVWDAANRRCVLLTVALQLYLVDDHTKPKEVFALHCEPCDSGTTLESRCKRSPHVHVSADMNLLSHAHIPLNFSQVDNVLSSAEAFSRSFSEALEIIEHEVILRIAREYS